MDSKPDYPFTNWTDYYAAFKCSLSSSDYQDEYPNYAKMIDNGENDFTIMYDLLTKYHLVPQEGLDGLIQSVIDAPRYAKDSRRIIALMIRALVNDGAVPKIDKIFELKYETADKCYFEDEVIDISVRAMLLDIMSAYDIDVSRFIDNSSITPMYWEDIPIAEYSYKTGFLMALKHESKYLQNLQ
jgi:hypothetical protein